MYYCFLFLLKYSNNDNIAAYYHNHRYYRYCSYTIDFGIIYRLSSIAYILNLYKVEDNNADCDMLHHNLYYIQITWSVERDNTDKDYLSRLFVEYTRTYCYTIDFDIIHIEIKILDDLHNRVWYSNGKTILIKLVLISLLKLHLLWQKK